MVRLLLLEDEDRGPIKARIEKLGQGHLKVDALPPPKDIGDATYLDENRDLFLIDYELDTRQADGSIAAYRGTTLGARVREIKPEFPIILLTRSDLPVWTSERRTVEASRTFDDVLYKEEDLRDNQGSTLSKLVSLAQGYRALRNVKDRTIASLLDSLGTDDEVKKEALQAHPPEADWKAVEAARWIRYVLLRYPGIMYDSAHAATALGISFDSFALEPVQTLLQSAKYRGPFCEEGRFWWRHKLFDIAYTLCESSDNTLGLRQSFRIAAGRHFNLLLEPSIDPESNLSPADTICYLLGIPVRIETSLPYWPDERPSVMDEARVSFKAIRETNQIQDNFLDSAGRGMLESIRQQMHGT